MSRLHGFDQRGTQRIIDTVRRSERQAAILEPVPNWDRYYDFNVVQWFELTGILYPNGTDAACKWIAWDAQAEDFLDEPYVAGKDNDVSDLWSKFWGVPGDRGASIQQRRADGTIKNQVVINPGRPIYAGETTGEWLAGTQHEVSTEGAGGTVPVVDTYMQSGTKIPAAERVRFYCNLFTRVFELLDAVNCPVNQ